MKSRSSLALFLAIMAGSSIDLNNAQVSTNGRLQVSGNQIQNKDGTSARFDGMSLFWSNDGWGGEAFYNAEMVANLKNKLGATIVRAAMGVDDEGGYISSPGNKNKVETVVDAAIANDLYVVIDWHSHHAENYPSQAADFFSQMAQKYGSYDNVIYEIYNEPLQISWSGTIKPYAQGVINAIRAHDPDNLIIVGTPTWSQDVDQAANDPINDNNVAYTLHFYAGTHGQSLRDKGNTALNKGVALMVTEWGTVNANGDGAVNSGETWNWVNWMKEKGVSSCNWSVNTKSEGASLLNPGASSTGSDLDSQLTASGQLVKQILGGGGGGDGDGCTNGHLARCGGNGWGGETCCQSGYTCTVANSNWSDCQKDGEGGGGSCTNDLSKQCGGRNWQGETCCQDGLTCRYDNEWWSDCQIA